MADTDPFAPFTWRQRADAYARRRWWFFVGLLAVVGILVYVAKFAPADHWRLSQDTEDWARFGEYVGGIVGVFAFLGVLITIDLQRRQLKQLTEQATVDELHRLCRELSTNIDKILDRSLNSLHVTTQSTAELNQRGLSPAIRNILQIVVAYPKYDPTDSATWSEHSSIAESGPELATQLDLLRNCLMDSEIRGGSPVVPAYYRDRYRETVRRLQLAGYNLKFPEYWLGNSTSGS
jgi:hypothetical protein